MPFLFNIVVRDKVVNPAQCSEKFHWALAGVAGSETSQHIDSGGYATVVEVLSGKKLWAVGTRADGNAFANDTQCLSRPDESADWQSIDRSDMRWECVWLGPGDIL